MKVKNRIETDMVAYDTIFGVVIIKDENKRPAKFKITTSKRELCDFINERQAKRTFYAFTSPISAIDYVKSQLVGELAFLFAVEGDKRIDVNRWYVRTDL